jgi:uncharacterized protein (DUF1499 family)
VSHLLLDHPAVKIGLYLLLATMLSLALLVLGIVFLVKGQTTAGLLAGRLSPCPDSSNCVCSEERPSGSAYIDPLVYDDNADTAWRNARQAVVDSGGTIVSEGDGYLWATYATRWLRFVDDIELRLDAQHHHIHMRSASRVGYYDFHVNRNRLERLRSLYEGRSTV